MRGSRPLRAAAPTSTSTLGMPPHRPPTLLRYEVRLLSTPHATTRSHSLYRPLLAPLLFPSYPPLPSTKHSTRPPSDTSSSTRVALLRPAASSRRMGWGARSPRADRWRRRASNPSPALSEVSGKCWPVVLVGRAGRTIYRHLGSTL